MKKFCTHCGKELENLESLNFCSFCGGNLKNQKEKNTEVEITRNLVLTFDDAGNCTLSSADADFLVTGTGKWTYHGAKKAWNDTDRDLIDLTYDATFKYNYGTEARYKKISTKESLIMRDRQSKFETFNIK